MPGGSRGGSEPQGQESLVLPLSTGWEEERDYNGHIYYIRHNTQQTLWIDLQDRSGTQQSPGKDGRAGPGLGEKCA